MNISKTSLSNCWPYPSLSVRQYKLKLRGLVLLLKISKETSFPLFLEILHKETCKSFLCLFEMCVNLFTSEISPWPASPPWDVFLKGPGAIAEMPSSRKKCPCLPVPMRGWRPNSDGHLAPSGDSTSRDEDAGSSFPPWIKPVNWRRWPQCSGWTACDQ